MKKHVKIDQNYYLVSQTVNSEVTVEVAKKTNHIYVVDVSGSMWGELQRLRTQLKNKLSDLMNEGDTITIIWFSGRNDCGILKEEVEVRSLKTLEDLHKAIDKWLQPIGMTAFLKPLQLAKEIIGRIKQNRPNSVFSLIFLTDGYNNDCPWNEVIASLKALESDLAAATFVEYGYYADAQKLTQMASVVGGEKVSTSRFDEFEPLFDRKISTPLMGGKKVAVEITDRYLYDFAFSVGTDGSVLLYDIKKGEHGEWVTVGSDVKEIHYFTPTAVGVEENTIPTQPLYAATYVLADKLMNDDAEKMIYVLGDQHYYQMLSNAFGKQKLNEFKTAIKECVADVAKRYPNGHGTIQKVPDNAYCLMNLINDLGAMEDVLFYPNHPDFDYHRVSRQRIAKGSNLSDADQKRLADAKTVDEANAILEELKTSNVDTKFVYTDKAKGSPMRDLVWNGERANLSILVKTDGKVTLPKNQWNLPEVPSFKFNAYTLIKDGIVNVAEIPVSYSGVLVELLTEKKVDYAIDYTWEVPVIMVDLTSIPLINKAMVKSISADALAVQEWELLKLQASTKVFDYYRKTLFPKESKSYIEQYGQECADWLKEIGVTDYNGYSPKTDAVESTDVYMSVNLITKVKGVSSLPKVEDVVPKVLANTKDLSGLKLSERLMAPAIIEYTEQLNAPIFATLSEDQKKTVLQNYLIKKSTEVIKAKRGIMQQIAQIKFSLILSKRWFLEFKSFDENKLVKQLDDIDVEFVFDLTEKEVKI